MSERGGGEGNLEWAAVMEECKRELSYVCQKMAQAVGWQFGRPYRPHAPKRCEQRQKTMRTRDGHEIPKCSPCPSVFFLYHRVRPSISVFFKGGESVCPLYGPLKFLK